MHRRKAMTKWFNHLVALAALCLLLPAAAQYPVRPVKIIVPFPPGSTGDLVPRAIAQRLQQSTGQPFVLESRPGAAGNIATEFVAKAAPDGYTLLTNSVAIAITPHLTKPAFDLQKDLIPLSQTIAGSYVLIAHPSFPANTLKEFIDEVKKNPGRHNYGSYGIGSGPHLAMELFKSAAGLEVQHVPFKGAAPAMQELQAGRVQFAFDTTVASIPHIRGGRIKAIALGGLRTCDVLPGVPTIAQTFAGFDTDGWQGFFAPAGTPSEVVQKLSAEIVRAVRSPEFVKQMKDLGFEAVGNTPEQFSALVQSEYSRYGRVIREHGIKAE